MSWDDDLENGIAGLFGEWSRWVDVQVEVSLMRCRERRLQHDRIGAINRRLRSGLDLERALSLAHGNTRHWLTWRGRQSPAVDVALEHGVSAATFRGRIRDGWNPLRAATTPTDARFRLKHFVTWRGKRRLAVDVAREHGVNAKAFAGRLQTGWEITEAMTTPLNRHVIVWRGEKRWFVDVARENGIRPQTAHNRLRRGWTPVDAATVPLRRREP